jgi:acyl-CoA thioesterase I
VVHRPHDTRGPEVGSGGGGVTVRRMNVRSVLTAVIALSAAAASASGTVVVIAPHPDDAESSCGGLIANTVAAGEQVVILTMTGGELGVWGKGADEARAIRSQEARRAAAALGAAVEFFGALDGSLTADAANTEKLAGILLRLEPAAVLAPWTLDVHPDHQAASLLAWRAFQDKRLAFALYFYETANGPHTTSARFVPTEYVDVTETFAKKREATCRHVSQNPAEWFEMYVALARVRGYEADVGYAEGYVRARNSSGLGGRPGTTARTLTGPRPGAAAPPQPPQDWAGLARYRADNARLAPPPESEPRVVFYGDSITEGWLAAAPAFFAGRPWLDRGISGQTTAQLLVRFRQDVVALRPRVVVILAGTNDLAGNGGPATPEMAFDNIVSMTEIARANGIRVVLSSVLPAADYPWRPGLDPAPKIVALNAMIRAFAARAGAVYLDYHSAMADARGGLAADLTRDGVHPDAAGYAVMGPLAEGAVRRALP